MGPAFGAGVAGNGNAMQAFMQGFHKSRQQWEEQQRQKQQDELAMEDRQRNIGRQRTADEIAAQERTRAGQVGKQQDFIRGQQAQGELVQTAGGMDDPDAAKRYIESMMPNLMSAFGQESMALGQPAVEQATQVITGRQKKQVEAFVESALKIEHVANNPDADPEITNLPAHIQKVIGKPSAKLSELQTFAQLPVGKPQGKTRVPPMAGSFEDYVQRKHGENATPEQILQARKEYQQSDDRPRITVNTGGGGYPPAVQRRVDAIVKGFDLQPIVKKTQTMAEAVSFADGLDINTSNPADDQALIYAFAKAMDPESVVREGEYATVQKYAQSWAQTFGFNAQRIFSNTSFLTPEARANLKKTIRAKFDAGRGQYENVRKEYGRKIERITQKPGGIEELTDFGAAFPQDAQQGKNTPPVVPATAGSAAPKRRRAPNGDLVEWDGKGWFKVGG
jgi:hypothetical protein